MAPISITIDTRNIERLVYWLIIVGLGVALAFTLLKDKDVTTDTGEETLQTGANSVTGAVTNESPPSEAPSAAVEPECQYNSDCSNGQICTEGACVEKPPECKEDVDCIDKGDEYTCQDGTCVLNLECEDDTDCEAGFECVETVCEELELSGDVTFSVSNIEYVYDEEAANGDGNTRLKSFDIIVENGLAKSIDYTGYVWFVSKSQRINIGDLNWAYKWGDGNQKTLDLPEIKSGATYQKKISFTHGDAEPGGNWPVTRISDGDQAFVGLWLYEDSDVSESDFDTEDYEAEYEFEGDLVIEG